MSPPLPTELYDYILRFLVDDPSLGDDFDQRIAPFHGDLPLYPCGRMTLATACSRVCSIFYDLAMPLVWQYLKIDDPQHLILLHRLSSSGGMRSFPLPLAAYTRRVDFNVWDSDSDTDVATELLSQMPGLWVLTCDNEFHGSNRTRVWDRSPSHRFLVSIGSNCPRLRRLQFLSSSEVPSLDELSLISRGCLELRTLQLSCLREGRAGTPVDSNAAGEGSPIEPLIFPSLKKMTIGTGNFCGSTLPSGGISARYFLQELRREPTSISHLEYLDAHIPFAHFDAALSLYKEELRSCVYHLYGSRYPPDLTQYRKLSRLILVVHGYGSMLPDGLSSIQTVEYVTANRGAWVENGDGHNGRGYDTGIRDVIRQQLDLLANGYLPSLQKVVLWRKVPGNCVLVEGLVRGFAKRFEAIGVVLEVHDQVR